MKKLALIIILLTGFFINSLYSQSFNFERIDPEYVHLNIDTNFAKSHYRITNNLSSPVQIRFIRTARNLPTGIVNGICDLGQCHGIAEDTTTGFFPPGISQTDIYIYFQDTSFAATGYGTVTYRAERVLNPNDYKIATFGVTTFPIGIKQISSIVKDFSLGQNYPNPFNPVTKIGFSLPKSDYVSLRVYDILGREVKVLVSQNMTPGEYEVDFDAKNLSSGMYYYSLRAGENVSVKKMVLVK